eukprot:sb/3476123/
MVTALGKSWHPEHFVCVRCNRELGSCKFFEKNDQPYCEEDYHAEFAPRCFACNMPIVDKCITALQKTWHPDCFVCVHCHDPFNRNGTEYHVYEGDRTARETTVKCSRPSAQDARRQYRTM